MRSAREASRRPARQESASTRTVDFATNFVGQSLGAKDVLQYTAKRQGQSRIGLRTETPGFSLPIMRSQDVPGLFSRSRPGTIWAHIVSGTHRSGDPPTLHQRIRLARRRRSSGARLSHGQCGRRRRDRREATLPIGVAHDSDRRRPAGRWSPAPNVRPMAAGTPSVEKYDADTSDTRAFSGRRCRSRVKFFNRCAGQHVRKQSASFARPETAGSGRRRRYRARQDF